MQKYLGLALALAVGTAAHAESTISKTQYHVTQKLALEGDGGWDFPTVDATNHRLYLSHGDHVLVVDTDSGKAVGSIPDTLGVHGVAIAPERGLGYISCGKANVVKVFNLKTLDVVATIPTGENPDVIIYEPSSHHVLAFNGRGKNISVIDTEKNAVIDTVDVGGKPEFAHADGHGHVYFDIENTSELAVLDTASDKIVNRWALAPCDEPSGLAIDVAHHRLFPSCGNKTMVVVDADNGKVISSLPIGDGTDGAAFDAEKGLFFSANGDGTLTIIRQIDADHYALAQNLTTQKGARTLALDPQTHKLYLPTAKFGEKTAGAKKPPIMPGSFTVLVVAPEAAN